MFNDMYNIMLQKEHEEREIKKEIRKIIKEEVPPMIENVMREKLQELIPELTQAVDYDVNSCMNIVCEDTGKMFTSEKARKFMSEQIADAFKKKWKEKSDFKIK